MKQYIYTESLIISIILIMLNLLLIIIEYIRSEEVYTILCVGVVFWLFGAVYSLIQLKKSSRS